MDRTQPKIPHSKDLRINRTRHPAKASALKNAETAALGKSPFGVSSGRRQTSFTLKSWARSLLALMKLREAIINEDISAVTKSLNSGINPNIQIGKTLNPLVAAVEVDNLELIQLLLNAGADVNLPLEHGHFGSVLVAACYHGNHKSVELLLEAGATVDMQVLHGDYGTALVAACCSETTKSAEILLDAGANPNFQVKNGTFGSALAAACCYLTATTLVPLLLEAGADPNLPLLYGNYGNAISSAIRNKSRSAAKSLLTYNAFLERFSDNLLSQIPGWGEEYSTGLSSGTSELIIFGTESWGADMHSVDFQEGKEELWLSSTVALIWQDDTIKLTTLWDWLNRFVSPSLGLRLLNGIRRALKYERDQFYSELILIS
ncbi:ankyrin repeat-containing domain protein [Penicillium angulare]|uniref:ankyrin repeat-containing domain protein n=1 Tax=Penicillium angulare TaxID=116970 RepID=UPI0025422B33|nr:ankyrin repeat-containing domain protein [Penicillium angulare]KAJ5281458.1 ankyrin repeat-containing domain protein [Penicillium angulare]